ncbi:MAG: carbohydrate porin [Coleofasciculaceae cyanobacterium RL_1_1]|nr:carbohydrate porin [Coleofasciculaceae cyanobacterium RL_1_1]
MKSVIAGITCILLGASSTIAATPARVEPVIEPDVTPPIPAIASPSVRDFVDVTPDDWAYQALQRLVEQYQCFEGDRVGQFDGRRSLSRYEFAAGLNQCLQAIEARFAALDDAIAAEAETWQTIQVLQRDFASELAALNRDIAPLEQRVETITGQQFSSTTVMGGEAIFSLVSATGGDPPGNSDPSTTLTYLSRLGFVSSFTGRDRLRLELLAGNFSDRGLANPDRFNTDMALLSFQSDTDSSVRLSKLEYRTAIGDRLVVTFRPVGFSLSSVLTANSPYFDAGRGSLSRFAEANPIFKLGSLDAGIGVDWLVADNLRLQVAYGAGDATDSQEGFFDAASSAIGAQLLLKPSPTMLAGLSYVNAYSDTGRLNTFTGSFRADTTSFLDEPTTTHAIGTTFQWRFARDLTLGAWGSLLFTESQTSDARATTSTYLISLGYSDPFGRDGDLLALLVGQPLRLIDGDDLPFGEDPDVGIQAELLYRLRLSDRIALTPGIIWIHNPEHDADNHDIWIAVLRTTLRF